MEPNEGSFGGRRGMAGAFGRRALSRHNPLAFQMSLVPGTRIGPCEIQSAIGAGGMGEVYRARARCCRTRSPRIPSGWLEGTLGVLVALEALRRHGQDSKPPVTLRLVDWADGNYRNG